MTSLSLPRIDVVTLPMKSGVFLGISVLSHDGGIFVSDIHSGWYFFTTLFCQLTKIISQR